MTLTCKGSSCLRSHNHQHREKLLSSNPHHHFPFFSSVTNGDFIQFLCEGLFLLWRLWVSWSSKRKFKTTAGIKSCRWCQHDYCIHLLYYYYFCMMIIAIVTIHTLVCTSSLVVITKHVPFHSAYSWQKEESERFLKPWTHSSFVSLAEEKKNHTDVFKNWSRSMCPSYIQFVILSTRGALLNCACCTTWNKFPANMTVIFTVIHFSSGELLLEQNVFWYCAEW